MGNLPVELIKNIPGFEGKYDITKDGQIWKHETKGKYKCKARWIPKHKSSSGYYKVHLNLNGKDEKYFIHKLVALTYLINPENKELVNHIDGNKLNNNMSNLEWATRSEDVKHSWGIGLRIVTEKMRRKASERGLNSRKLSMNEAVEIRKKYTNGNITQKELSEIYGISKTQIFHIVNNHSYINNLKKEVA